MAAGLSKEAAQKILTDLAGAYVPKTEVEQLQNQLKVEDEKVKERDKQIKELQSFKGTAEELSTKVKELSEANSEKDKEYKQQLEAERINNAVKLTLLTDAEHTPHNLDMVIGLLDMSKVKVSEDGKTITGVEEQVKEIKTNNSFLFKEVEKQQNNQQQQQQTPPVWQVHGTPPKNPGGNNNVDNQESFGKALAASKLSALGINVNPNTTNQGGTQ